MPYANINIDPANIFFGNVHTQLDQVKTELPFLINLTPKERQKAGVKSRQLAIFSIIALEIASNEPTLVPPTLDLVGMKNDLDLKRELTLVKQKVDQLQEALDDTILALKSETSQTASLFYKTLQNLLNSNIPGIDTMVARLKEAQGNTRGKAKIKAD